MPAKSISEFSVKLVGPGLTFDRPVSEEIATSIINLVMTGVASTPPAATGGNLGAPSGGAALQSPMTLNGITIKQFLAQKRPANTYQRVACLAYYLTHALLTPHFKTKDISKANTDAAAPKLSNPSLFVNDATTKYGYLSPAGSGKKQITAFGEEVVDALPDSQKVKQIHEGIKQRSRKKSKKKNK